MEAKLGKVFELIFYLSPGLPSAGRGMDN